MAVSQNTINGVVSLLNRSDFAAGDVQHPPQLKNNKFKVTSGGQNYTVVWGEGGFSIQTGFFNRELHLGDPELENFPEHKKLLKQIVFNSDALNPRFTAFHLNQRTSGFCSQLLQQLQTDNPGRVSKVTEHLSPRSMTEFLGSAPESAVAEFISLNDRFIQNQVRPAYAYFIQAQGSDGDIYPQPALKKSAKKQPVTMDSGVEMDFLNKAESPLSVTVRGENIFKCLPAETAAGILLSMTDTAQMLRLLSNRADAAEVFLSALDLMAAPFKMKARVNFYRLLRNLADGGNDETAEEIISKIHYRQLLVLVSEEKQLVKQQRADGGSETCFTTQRIYDGCSAKCAAHILLQETDSETVYKLLAKNPNLKKAFDIAFVSYVTSGFSKVKGNVCQHLAAVAGNDRPTARDVINQATKDVLKTVINYDCGKFALAGIVKESDDKTLCEALAELPAEMCHQYVKKLSSNEDSSAGAEAQAAQTKWQIPFDKLTPGQQFLLACKVSPERCPELLKYRTPREKAAGLEAICDSDVDACHKREWCRLLAGPEVLKEMTALPAADAANIISSINDVQLALAMCSQIADPQKFCQIVEAVVPADYAMLIAKQVMTAKEKINGQKPVLMITEFSPRFFRKVFSELNRYERAEFVSAIKCGYGAGVQIALKCLSKLVTPQFQSVFTDIFSGFLLELINQADDDGKDMVLDVFCAKKPAHIKTAFDFWEPERMLQLAAKYRQRLMPLFLTCCDKNKVTRFLDENSQTFIDNISEFNEPYLQKTIHDLVTRQNEWVRIKLMPKLSLKVCLAGLSARQLGVTARIAMQLNAGLIYEWVNHRALAECIISGDPAGWYILELMVGNDAPNAAMSALCEMTDKRHDAFWRELNVNRLTLIFKKLPTGSAGNRVVAELAKTLPRQQIVVPAINASRRENVLNTNENYLKTEDIIKLRAAYYESCSSGYSKKLEFNKLSAIADSMCLSSTMTPEVLVSLPDDVLVEVLPKYSGKAFAGDFALSLEGDSYRLISDAMIKNVTGLAQRISETRYRKILQAMKESNEKAYWSFRSRCSAARGEANNSQDGKALRNLTESQVAAALIDLQAMLDEPECAAYYLLDFNSDGMSRLIYEFCTVNAHNEKNMRQICHVINKLGNDDLMVKIISDNLNWLKHYAFRIINDKIINRVILGT